MRAGTPRAGWGSVRLWRLEYVVEEALPDARARSPPLRAASGAPRPFAEVEGSETLRRATGLAELDRVLGGGLVQGSVVLVGGDPGIGKSTLALQACGALAGQGCRCCTWRARSPLSRSAAADRLGMAGAGVLVVAETGGEAVPSWSCRRGQRRWWSTRSRRCLHGGAFVGARERRPGAGVGRARW
jgi:predicted ATP-dependent serine protease